MYVVVYFYIKLTNCPKFLFLTLYVGCKYLNFAHPCQLVTSATKFQKQHNLIRLTPLPRIGVLLSIMLSTSQRIFTLHRITLRNALRSTKYCLVPPTLTNAQKQLKRGISTESFINSQNFPYTKELGREFTESMLAKFFAVNNNDHIAKALSVSVIESMLVSQQSINGCKSYECILF